MTTRVLITLAFPTEAACLHCQRAITKEDCVLVVIERKVWTFCSMRCADPYDWPRASGSHAPRRWWRRLFP